MVIVTTETQFTEHRALIFQTVFKNGTSQNVQDVHLPWAEKDLADKVCGKS